MAVRVRKTARATGVVVVRVGKVGMVAVMEELVFLTTVMLVVVVGVVVVAVGV